MRAMTRRVADTKIMTFDGATDGHLRPRIWRLCILTASAEDLYGRRRRFRRSPTSRRCRAIARVERTGCGYRAAAQTCRCIQDPTTRFSDCSSLPGRARMGGRISTLGNRDACCSGGDRTDFGGTWHGCIVLESGTLVLQVNTGLSPQWICRLGARGESDRGGAIC
jgi:hypothetical protein